MFSIHVSRRPVERLSKSQIHYLVESDRESAHVMIGTKLAHYDITSHLGNGGMGEVYQATDTKLGRSVAVKLLPEVFANDADRVARFEREARVLASLNHPNIAAIYGVEESSDRKFLVMELVPGETLAERIARSPIPVEEALDIAEHICEALEAAHEKGVVHRDLKPANVKITPEGNVKVLDFGLAKVYESANPTQNLSNSPTLSAIHTIDGVILGTAAYMSPEQARGRHVDRRGDIWAFGCVLYEMLTGRQAFPNGETVSDTLAGILKAEPLWNVLPANTPLKVRALLERCLRKEVRRRLPHIGEARIEIDEAQNEPDPGTPPTALVRSYRRFLWIAVASLTFAAGIFAASNFLAPVRDTRIVRFDIVGLLGATVDVGEPLSPDGRKVAYTANFDGKRSIWIRTLDSSVAEPLPGTRRCDAADLVCRQPKRCIFCARHVEKDLSNRRAAFFDLQRSRSGLGMEFRGRDPHRRSGQTTVQSTGHRRRTNTGNRIGSA